MRLIPVFGGYLHFLRLLGSVPLDHLYPRHTQYISKPLSESDTCRQGGRTRKYSSRWRSRTRQSLGVGSPWASQGRVSRPGRKGFKSSKSWSMTSRHARRTARSRAARGLGGVRVNWPADWDDCCCCRLSVDFLHRQWTTINPLWDHTHLCSSNRSNCSLHWSGRSLQLSHTALNKLFLGHSDSVPWSSSLENWKAVLRGSWN